jgi:hypothetical protein
MRTSITWNHFYIVVPAKAGTQGHRHVACPWVPAFAGTAN